MRAFSIPYNNDKALLKELFVEFPDTAGSCKEIYFAAPAGLMGTGRVVSQGKEYLREIVELIEEARKYGVETNLLMNSGCLGLKMADSAFITEVTGYISDLMDTAGLDVITFSDYILAKAVKKAIPGLKLECSSIAYVDSLEKARYWEEIGCNMLVIPPVMNKNMRFIRQLHDCLPGIQLKMVVNQECLCGCPMWHGHHNLRGHGDEGETYWSACKEFFEKKPWAYFSSSYIPPGYLGYFDQTVSIYKLVDRRNTTRMILDAFGIYSGDSRYSGRARECDGRIPEDVFKKVLACNKNCACCNYCRDQWFSRELII